MRGKDGGDGMIGKIIALCFIGLVVFLVGIFVGMAIEERIQDDIRERGKWNEYGNDIVQGEIRRTGK